MTYKTAIKPSAITPNMNLE